jgi:hypothetical protein
MTNPDLTADSTAGNFARTLFDLEEFAAEQFLSGFQADVQSLTWCLKKALVKHAGIDCSEASPFAFGDYGIEPTQRWAWTIVDLRSSDGRHASFVASAAESSGVRLYSFEADHGFIEDIPLAGNAAKIFDFLMHDLLPQFS